MASKCEWTSGNVCVAFADPRTRSYVYVQDSSEYAPSQLPFLISSRVCCPCDPSTVKLSLRHFFAHHVPGMCANSIVLGVQRCCSTSVVTPPIAFTQFQCGCRSDLMVQLPLHLWGLVAIGMDFTVRQLPLTVLCASTNYATGRDGDLNGIRI